MADDKSADDTPVEGKETEVNKQPELKGRLLTEEESTDWGNEVTFEEKDAKTEQSILRKELEIATEESEEEKPEESESEKIEEQLPAPVETIEIEDPGEFTPQDYSFEVVTYDDEGKKPKTVKVTSIEQWDELLESDPNMGSSAAVGKAFRKAQKMEIGIERDLAEYEVKKSEYEAAVESEQLKTQRNDTIFNEMQYLMDKGDLPKLTNEELTNLDWEDAAVVKAHPNIAPHKELLNYMRKENASRTKSKLAPLSSVLDAFNAMQLDSNRQKVEENKTKVAEARKQAGARVASGTPGPGQAVSPKGIAVGRVGDLSRLGQNWQV